jgi:hypothetical protein
VTGFLLSLQPVAATISPRIRVVAIIFLLAMSGPPSVRRIRPMMVLSGTDGGDRLQWHVVQVLPRRPRRCGILCKAGTLLSNRDDYRRKRIFI